MKKASLALAISVGVCSPAIWAATTQIDVLGLYTPDTVKGFEQDHQDHVAHIQHSVNVANKVLKDSGLDIKVNLAATKEVQYDTQRGLKKSQSEVLDAATPFNLLDPAFADVEAYRQQVGADMVAIFRYLDVNNSPDYERLSNGSYSINCGVAWVVGPSDWKAPQHAKKKLYSHSYLNECPSETFIHELGHNLGLNHAHEQQKGFPHLSNGTEVDAYGYGVKNQFATIMAYPHFFGVEHRYKFSSPNSSCGWTSCGVKNYADSVRAIGLTAPLIANAYASASTPVEGGTPEDTEPTTNTDKVFVVKGPVALPDKQTLSLPIKVSAQTATTVQVAIDLTHEYSGDLSIVLYTPDDSYWILKKVNRYDRNQSYNMKINLTVDDPLATEGEWRLEVQDHWAGKVGTLNSFQITFP
ncbi:zinc-dependent metalloprotease family protein [Vibrio cholerae]|nr:proprotein convertase P-domain-containing protein [Vibrio cholerae]